MTTNGHITARTVAVVALDAVEAERRPGWHRRAVTDPAQLDELVRAAETSAREAGPAADACRCPSPARTRAGGRPDETSIGVFARFAEGLAEVLDGPQRHYGFASHDLSTAWLGTSAGVRRRWVQPTGSIELNVKTPDLDGSAWTGMSTVDFTDVDVVALGGRHRPARVGRRDG